MLEIAQKNEKSKLSFLSNSPVKSEIERFEHLKIK